MTVAVTACFRYVVDSELAFGDIVTRLGGHTAAAAAPVIKKLLNMVVGVLGCIGSAVLVKGTEASMRAMGTCNLICGSVSANTSVRSWRTPFGINLNRKKRSLGRRCHRTGGLQLAPMSGKPGQH